MTWSIVETGLAHFWFQSDLDVLKIRRFEWERHSMENSSYAKNPVYDEGPSSLKLVHMFGLGYIFMGGSVCGLICFVTERIWKRFPLLLKLGMRFGIKNPRSPNLINKDMTGKILF